MSPIRLRGMSERSKNIESIRVRYMRISFLVFGTILLAILFVVNSHAPAGRELIQFEKSLDRACYYNIAHSIIYDSDFDFSNQFKALPPDSSEFIYIHPTTGLPTNPFAIGYPILEIPFLVSGHWITKLVSGYSNGYSWICQAAWYVGIIVYLCLGMFFLFEFLRSFARSLCISARKSDWSSWITVFAIYPGTTIAYYSFSGFAHAVAFSTICVFFYTWWRAKDSSSVLKWSLFGLSSGIATLCRWQSGLFLIIPIIVDIGKLYLWKTKSENINFQEYRIIPRLSAIAIFVVVLIPQALEWKAIYGSYFTIPQGEGFIQFPPIHFMEALFSSFHGWFIWTPIALLGVIGLVYGIWRYAIVFVPVLITLVFQLILIGSQRINWHGHHSFGIRHLTESSSLVAMGLVMLLSCSHGNLRRWILAMVALCICWSTVFAIQYRLDMIPKMDRLTVDELVFDKIYLSTALRRHQKVGAARLALVENNPNEAMAILLKTKDQFGDSRELLEVLAVALRQLGNIREESNVKTELEILLERRLY